jgi:hypothetical protein
MLDTDGRITILKHGRAADQGVRRGVDQHASSF